MSRIFGPTACKVSALQPGIEPILLHWKGKSSPLDCQGTPASESSWHHYFFPTKLRGVHTFSRSLFSVHFFFPTSEWLIPGLLYFPLHENLKQNNKKVTQSINDSQSHPPSPSPSQQYSELQGVVGALQLGTLLLNTWTHD